MKGGNNGMGRTFKGLSLTEQAPSQDVRHMRLVHKSLSIILLDKSLPVDLVNATFKPQSGATDYFPSREQVSERMAMASFV